MTVTAESLLNVAVIVSAAPYLLAWGMLVAGNRGGNYAPWSSRTTFLVLAILGCSTTLVILHYFIPGAFLANVLRVVQVAANVGILVAAVVMQTRDETEDDP